VKKKQKSFLVRERYHLLTVRGKAKSDKHILTTKFMELVSSLRTLKPLIIKPLSKPIKNRNFQKHTQQDRNW